jgi:hypothetical protein
VNRIDQQWLACAAFVALTVAGQQGHFPPSPIPLPIFDFGLPIFDWVFQSKIQNLESKIGGGSAEGEAPLSLNPSAADYRSFITSSIRASVCLLHQKKETVPFVGSLEKTKNKARLIPTSRRLFGLSGERLKNLSLSSGEAG